MPPLEVLQLILTYVPQLSIHFYIADMKMCSSYCLSSSSPLSLSPLVCETMLPAIAQTCLKLMIFQS